MKKDNTNLLSRWRLHRLVETDDFGLALIPEGPEEILVLAAENLRVFIADRLDQEAIRSVSSHRDQRLDVHAMMGNTE
jgi:hypothetical protein